LYILVVTEEKVFFCAVLTVGHHSCYRGARILRVSLDESTHFMPVIDNTGGVGGQPTALASSHDLTLKSSQLIDFACMESVHPE